MVNSSLVPKGPSPNTPFSRAEGYKTARDESDLARDEDFDGTVAAADAQRGQRRGPRRQL